MKITKIIEKPIRLQSNISNAVVNFSQHTVSLLAIVTDRTIANKQAIGLSFNSIGRYAQSGILHDRMIPRLLNASPESLLQHNGELLCPEKVIACAMQNEKPGGHGDRAHAASALELAVWDLNAKLLDEPAANTIARHFEREASPVIDVYAAGGYYYPGEDIRQLRDELMRYKDAGFKRFKMKIGGDVLAQDIRRIETALQVAEAGNNLAVDANGRFNLEQALAYARAIDPYDLMWYEEAGDPLDFELNSKLAEVYKNPLATGENLFSHQDVKNLVLFGGMRPRQDIFQMDSGLSYGVIEYTRMLHEMECRGFSRHQAIPHGGQLMALHVVAGLGLGGCEVYPNIFQPLGGFENEVVVNESQVRLSDTAGFGFEKKSALAHEFVQMLQ